jgi:hypothetical protein
MSFSTKNLVDFKDEKYVALSKTKEFGIQNLVMMFCSKKEIT